VKSVRVGYSMMKEVSHHGDENACEDEEEVGALRGIGARFIFVSCGRMGLGLFGTWVRVVAEMLA